MNAKGQENRPLYMFMDNDGQKLRGSNYWDSEYARRGIVYFSVNAGAIRVLLPDNVDPALFRALPTTEYVTVSRNAAGSDYEVLFEDGTGSPYVIQTPVGAWDAILPKSDSGREDIPFLLYTNGCRLRTVLEARFRVVQELPCLQPWRTQMQQAMDVCETQVSSRHPAVAATLGHMWVPEISYHSPLPPELEPWYCYVRDGGHSILVLLKQYLEECPDDPWGGLVPIPVKSVLRGGYFVKDGYIVAENIEYDECMGAITPEEEDEY